MICNCLKCRRERAQKLIDALNEDAGEGRVLSGLAQVVLFSMANSVEQLDLPFCGRTHDNAH